jgi:hypothetical protein
MGRHAERSSTGTEDGVVMLTIVTGPPCAGKTTHVRQHALPGDIVIDFDALAVALGSPVSHGHGDQLCAVAREARNAAINAAICQHHRGHRVWIIDTAPSAIRLKWYRSEGGRPVKLMADRSELHRRADADGRPPSWHTQIDQCLGGGALHRDPLASPRTRW